jgi:hypothetical protein
MRTKNKRLGEMDGGMTRGEDRVRVEAIFNAGWLVAFYLIGRGREREAELRG